MTTPVFDISLDRFNQVSFRLIVPKNSNRMQGRRTEARLFGTPYWRAEYQFTNLFFEESGRADAWLRKVDSRGGVFRAYDAHRPRPIRAGKTPLTWTPNLSSITNGGRTVAITGVGASFQFKEGDYVAFKRASSDLMVSLHSIAADANANGSGNVTLQLDPAIDTQHFTAVNSNPIFEKPYCLMQIEDYSSQKGLITAAPSFSAQEVFFYGS
jgi:hypothetical protein